MDNDAERLEAFYWSRGHIGESLKSASYDELVKLKELLEYKLEHGHCPDHEKEPGEVRNRKRRGSARLQKSLRAQLVDRDGEFCIVCKGTTDLTVDHILPLALGGANALENVQFLCQRCHTKKNFGDARKAKKLFFETKFPDKVYSPGGSREDRDRNRTRNSSAPTPPTPVTDGQ